MAPQEVPTRSVLRLGTPPTPLKKWLSTLRDSRVAASKWASSWRRRGVGGAADPDSTPTLPPSYTTRVVGVVTTRNLPLSRVTRAVWVMLGEDTTPSERGEGVILALGATVDKSDRQDTPHTTTVERLEKARCVLFVVKLDQRKEGVMSTFNSLIRVEEYTIWWRGHLWLVASSE